MNFGTLMGLRLLSCCRVLLTMPVGELVLTGGGGGTLSSGPGPVNLRTYSPMANDRFLNMQC